MGDPCQYFILLTSSFLKLSPPFSHSLSLTPDTMIFLLAVLIPAPSSLSVNTLLGVSRILPQDVTAYV